MSDDVCGHRFCSPDRCFAAEREAAKARPTAAPPSARELAEDLRMRARRLDTMAEQLRREAADLFFAASRIEETGR